MNHSSPVPARPFHDVYANQIVLVTGHTGFKGSWLVAWLLRLNARVIGYSKDVPTTPSMFELCGLADRMEHYFGDVRDLASLKKVIATTKPRFVFHLAAQPIVSASYTNPLETLSSNVMGTANLLESLRGVDWLCTTIVITSDKCYDNVEWVWGYRESDALGGKDIYSGSKAAVEQIFKSYWHSFFNRPGSTVQLATARAGNVIGGGDWAVDRIVADCIRAWVAGRSIEIRSPSATRPWQHALEPLSGYLALAEHMARTGQCNGESYNFGPRADQNRTVVQLLRDLGEIWGFDSREQSYSVVGNAPFHEASLLKLNCDKALLNLSWESNLSYSECMSMTGLWYRQVLRENRDALECTQAQIAHYEQLATERHRVWISDKAV